MLKSFSSVFTTYTTTPLIRVRSPVTSTLSLILIILLLTTFLVSINFNLKRVYTSTCNIRGEIRTFVKGKLSTRHFTDQDLSVTNPSAYRKLFDSSDLMIPKEGADGQMGSFTLVTNMIISETQTLGKCAVEYPPNVSEDNFCESEDDCKKDYWPYWSEGPLTGRCIMKVNSTGSETKACEIEGWCPQMKYVFPRGQKQPLLEGVSNFILSIYNTVRFPQCSDAYINNWGTKVSNNTEDGYDCLHDLEGNPMCANFKIGDIVRWSGSNFTDVAVLGGVFNIKIRWRCHFNLRGNMEECRPYYKFSRMDDPEDYFSSGWGFRSTEYDTNSSRRLILNRGLRFIVDVDGEGRKPDFFVFIMTFGSAVGLFCVVPFICELVLPLLNSMCNSKSKLHECVDRYVDDSVNKPNSYRLGMEPAEEEVKNGTKKTASLRNFERRSSITSKV